MNTPESVRQKALDAAAAMLDKAAGPGELAQNAESATRAAMTAVDVYNALEDK